MKTIPESTVQAMVTCMTAQMDAMRSASVHLAANVAEAYATEIAAKDARIAELEAQVKPKKAKTDAPE